jgi:hypothetical protein
MAGLREGERKTIHINRVSESLQKSDESPIQFYERLLKHAIYILPSILRPLKISKRSMSPLWGKPRGTLEKSYKNYKDL